MARSGTTVSLRVGQISLFSNGKLIEYMDTAPVIKNNRVFLPVRCVAEAFGHTVTWDEGSMKITIKPKGNSRDLTLKTLPNTKDDTNANNASQFKWPTVRAKLPYLAESYNLIEDWLNPVDLIGGKPDKIQGN